MQFSVVSCGDPGTPDNGVRYGDTFKYQSTVVLECDPGYKLAGNITRTCQVDGNWSGSQPTCQRKYRIHSRSEDNPIQGHYMGHDLVSTGHTYRRFWERNTL